MFSNIDLLKFHTVFIFLLFAGTFFLINHREKQAAIKYYAAYFICLAATWSASFVEFTSYRLLSSALSTLSFYLLFIAGLKRDDKKIPVKRLNTVTIFCIVALSLSMKFNDQIWLKAVTIFSFYLPIILLSARNSWQRENSNIGDKIFSISLVTFLCIFSVKSQIPSEALHSAYLSKYLYSLLSITLGISLILSYLLDSNRAIEEISITDPLTKLLNRRGLEKVFSFQLASAIRDHRNAAVIILDIDHFKKINDTYGHAAGDVVLTHVAKLLQQETRENDTLVRLGGEEFCVFLTNISNNELSIVAEKLRHKIELLDINIKDTKINLTASLGTYLSQAKSFNLENALEWSDQALYRAKETGRNKVVSANIVQFSRDNICLTN